MAKYRRSYRRFRKTGRWAPNIAKISSVLQATQGEFFDYEELAENPIQVNTGVSQAYTVKNFEITFTIETPHSESQYSNQFLDSITAYVMYVPQGMTITAGYYAEHPEYILAYKFLGSPTNQVYYQDGSFTRITEQQQYQPIRIRTRLSRKLQTGDKVILYIQGSCTATSARFNLDGIVRWWSKAN